MILIAPFPADALQGLVTQLGTEQRTQVRNAVPYPQLGTEQREVRRNLSSMMQSNYGLIQLYSEHLGRMQSPVLP
jgi:hypothetical protein